jgi:hypothetical protein
VGRRVRAMDATAAGTFATRSLYEQVPRDGANPAGHAMPESGHLHHVATPQEGAHNGISHLWRSKLHLEMPLGIFYIQLGLGLLVSVTAKYCLGATALILGQELQPTICKLIIASSLIISYFSIYSYYRKAAALPSILVVLIYIISLYLATFIRDTSVDGQQYHFQAIYALAHGWNPYHGAYHVPVELAPLSEDLWVVVYPKAAWIASAIDYSAGWPLEAVKGQTTILLLASFFSALGVLLELGYTRLSAVFVAVAAAANPVTLTQLFTRMNDGLLGSTILLFVVFMIDWVRTKRSVALIGIAAATVFAINLKFSAIPFFGLFCVFSCLAWLNESGTASAIFSALILLSFGALATLVLGYAPYVDNFVNHGHPFYPLMGHDTVDVIDEQYPDIFRRMSTIQRFFFSLFADTHSGFATEPYLKIPFSVSWSGLRYAGNPDARIGGFGPLYSGALLVAFAAALRILALRNWSKKVAYTALAAGALLISVAVFPENWWARYVPHFWLLPCISAVLAVSLDDRPARFLGWAVLVTMVLNATAVFATSVWLDIKRDRAIDAQINQMRSEGGHFCVFFELAEARLYLFRNAHLSFTPVPQPMTCAQSEALVGYGPDRTGGEVCRCSAPAE